MEATQRFSNDKLGIALTVNIGQLSPGRLLQDRVVFITGGTTGIGYQIAQKCVAQGARVIVTGRNQGAIDRARYSLGESCEGILFDVRDFKRYGTLFEEATKYFGNINCLVNNAGISLHEGSFMNVTEHTWDAQLDTNLKAPYFLTQAWLRYYREKQMKLGRILMMASDTSGMGSTIPYGITKAGIASFTRGLAKHIVLEGIRVNAIAPGTTRTAMTEDFTKGEIVRDSTEGKRVLFPEEIAETAVFLLSDLSTCISGQVIGCTESNVCFDNSEWSNLSLEQETNP